MTAPGEGRSHRRRGTRKILGGKWRGGRTLEETKGGKALARRTFHVARDSFRGCVHAGSLTWRALKWQKRYVFFSLSRRIHIYSIELVNKELSFIKIANS